MKTLKLTIFLLLSFVFSSSAKEISVMTYNLCNYFTVEDGIKPKADDSKKALMEMIKGSNPDILFVVELGGEKSLEDLTVNLKAAGCKDYVFAEEMTGDDESRHIGLISKFKPVIVEKKDNLFYKIKPKDRQDGFPEKVFVQRGFLHAVFEFENGYRLHILGAHLKSRLPHPRYIQTDMRRYEARLLRYQVNDILEKEPDANILVVGDFNDVYSSDPMQTLRAHEKPLEKRLFDLRPVDSKGLPWTHWWHGEDVYGRIDYALASTALLPEINFDKTKVVHMPEYWMFASDHRPVLVTIKMDNAKALDKETLDKNFPNEIFSSYKTTDNRKNLIKGGDPETLPVLFMDMDDYSTDAPAEKKNALFEQILRNRSQIFVFTGLRDVKCMEEIAGKLADCTFKEMINGPDKESHIAVLSKIKPEKFEALTEIKYKIEGKDLPVGKGFAHCVFNIDGYKFHLLAADLKDRNQDPEYNQTDMRRYEARQLRYLVNDISKAEPGANILVIGNLNDTCGMSPLKELYYRRGGIEKRLFDIRPLDPMKTTWTHWDSATDDYERIDYALASFSMISEIYRDRACVIYSDEWQKASSHRPFIVNILCKDAGKPLKEDLDKLYPYSIYSGEAVHFEEDREIGDKPERKTADPVEE